MLVNPGRLDVAGELLRRQGTGAQQLLLVALVCDNADTVPQRNQQRLQIDEFLVAVSLA